MPPLPQTLSSAIEVIHLHRQTPALVGRLVWPAPLDLLAAAVYVAVSTVELAAPNLVNTF